MDVYWLSSTNMTPQLFAFGLPTCNLLRATSSRGGYEVGVRCFACPRCHGRQRVPSGTLKQVYQDLSSVRVHVSGQEGAILQGFLEV